MRIGRTWLARCTLALAVLGCDDELDGRCGAECEDDGDCQRFLICEDVREIGGTEGVRVCINERCDECFAANMACLHPPSGTVAGDTQSRLRNCQFIGCELR